MTASEVRYLFTVRELCGEKGGSVRSKDVAERLNLSRASVCRAMDRLSEKQYIVRRESGRIGLTPKGDAAVAEYDKCVAVIRREIMDRFGCRENIAAKDALNVVCALSESNFEKLLASSEKEAEYAVDDSPARAGNEDR